ncbi:fibropellin-1-like [Ditylenchus destructor]|nr:fibropellin-1-like [Ditylenchus destructor]
MSLTACAVVRCRAGYHCIPVASPCCHPPCPLRAECVKDCCPLECPPGQHCELQPVVCVRAPCPPKPACVKNDHSLPWDAVDPAVDKAKAIDVTDEPIDSDLEAVKSPEDQ